MPGGGDHRRWTRRLLGNSHPEVHRWVDWPHRFMGRNHRMLFHDPISAPAVGSLAALVHGNNPLTGAAAGLIHIGQDSIVSALGGSKRRGALGGLGSIGGLLLPVAALLLLFLAPLLILLPPILLVIFLIDHAHKSEATTQDDPQVSQPLPSPPSELQSFVLESHRNGMSRRAIAMHLIKRGCTCKRAQGLLSELAREESTKQETAALSPVIASPQGQEYRPDTHPDQGLRTQLQFQFGGQLQFGGRRT